MPNVIEVNNVSKKYRIYHEQQDSSPTLVGTLSAAAKRWWKKLRHPLTSSASRTTHEDFLALKDVSVEIKEGDRIGVIGRNGAGKSTLLKILTRITYPSTGSIKIRGRVASLLEVGTGFHPELTGRENIYLNGAILGMRNQEILRKFDEIVAFAEVEKFLDTPVKRFSSGMYTRLGFAIAAHLDPDVLIVDEVLSVGDSQFQAKCLKKLNTLSSHGRTVVFVSHDIGSVITLCNKGLFLEKGCVKAYGPIEESVNMYMQSLKMHSLSWVGSAGDEHIRFLSANLSKPMENKEFYFQGEKIRLEIEYEVLLGHPDLFFGCVLVNQHNQQLARVHTFDNLEHEQSFITPGFHRAYFEIDTNMFHEGEYLLRMECIIHNKKHVLNEEIILKLPIYSLKKNTRYVNCPNVSGIMLGNHWQKMQKNQLPEVVKK